MTMKYPHILDNDTQPEKKLVFTLEIDPQDGSHHKISFLPADFKNVRHIRGNLYCAWDDEPTLGCVLLGEYK
jgi:hypothetical protein